MAPFPLNYNPLIKIPVQLT